MRDIENIPATVQMDNALTQPLYLDSFARLAASASNSSKTLSTLDGGDLNAFPGDSPRQRAWNALVMASRPRGFQATATVNLTGDAVTSLTITNQGKYPPGVTPAIVISGDGSGATAVAVMNGPYVIGATVTAGGTLYTAATAAIDAPAAGPVTLDSFGAAPSGITVAITADDSNLPSNHRVTTSDSFTHSALASYPNGKWGAGTRTIATDSYQHDAP